MNYIKKPALSLKYKFVLGFIFLVTLPTLCIGVYIYYQMNESFQEQAVELTKGMVNKIDENMSTVIQESLNISLFSIYNEDFRDYMRSSEIHSTNYEKSTENIKGYLNFQLISKEYISSIIIEGANGSRLELGEPITSMGNLESKWKKLAYEKKGGVIWSDVYSVKSGWGNENKEIISLFRVINDYNSIKEPLGLITIRLDVNKLRELITIPPLQDKGSVFISDDKGNILLNGNSDFQDIINDQNISKDNLEKPSFKYSSNHQEYLLVTRKIEDSNWSLSAIVNESKIAEDFGDIKTLVLIMIIILTILGMLALIIYYYTNIKRIIKLSEITKHVGDRNFNVKVNDKSEDEIGILGSRFNRMIETIQKYIDIEYKLKIKQKETEIKVLQNQIDPHFLYNTLDMIRWTARLEKAEETSHLIEEFSALFRDTLKNSGVWIPIKNECLFIKSYLELQQVRLGPTFSFSIFIDSEIENNFLIRQILQPLVENSIKHGFQEQSKHKKIIVRFYRRRNKLFIDVIDNGKGIEQNDLIKNLHEGHALKNLQDRIQLAFGYEYGLKLISSEKQGTWIQLQMPLLFNEPEAKDLYDFNKGD